MSGYPARRGHTEGAASGGTVNGAADRTVHAEDAAGGWRWGGAVFGLLLQLCCVAYAARHVSPAALGAYAVALTAVHLLAHLAGGAIAASLDRAGPPTRPAAHAALRLAGITGFTGFAVAQLAAPLPALLLHTPGTTPLLRLLACAFLCRPAADAASAALRRAGRPRDAVLTDAGGQAAGAATGILLLAGGVNPLGLAAVLPVSAAVALGAAALLLSRTPLPEGPPVQAASLIRVPWFEAGFGLLRLVAAGAPLWAVCGLLGPGAAGVYARAAGLCEVPVTVYGRVASRTAGGSREADRHRASRPVRRVDVPTARLAVTAASAAGFAGFGIVAGAGPAALALLLGPGWESATALVPWLCAAGALHLVYSAGCSLDLARGRRRELLGTHLVVLLATAAALAVVLPWRGSGSALPLLACAAAAGPAAGHALQLVRWGRCGLVRAREALRAHAVHCGIGAAAGALATLAGSAAAAPGDRLLYGLLALTPVALLCAGLHEQLPLSAALSGDRPGPAPAPRPRTPAPRGTAGAPAP